ncbi:DUF1080 domain-containing protein [Flavobacteriaceae bacterium TP-CH-4]|uniref:DUF1080 domain-containing protein n=1 Tax=Pelagihabitans pacificus TaxID=2696054 RepID=A0A967AQG4_9FLAO|nr:DUF1080 domain-containing protein [Pelagihabitans pacificus]NHF58484.1 DUF1080 domain-containing protein [Pelagihabitans pacificus]
MKILPVCLLFLFVAVPFLNNPSAKKGWVTDLQDPKWEPLFNGTNLDGWYMVVKDSSFTGTVDEIFAVKEDAIHVYPGQEPHSLQTFAGLVTEETYDNYKLRMEYKWGEKKFRPRHGAVRDAGIIFHMHGKEMIWPYGIECQIQEGDTGDVWAIGSKVSSTIQDVVRNYDPKGTLTTRGDTLQTFQRFHRSYCWEVPGWNTIEIHVKENNAVFLVNGKVVNEALDMRYWSKTDTAWEPLTEGKIMIQAEGAELFYRNIELQKL